MPYIITGTATYSSQTNRNAAQTAIAAALTGTTAVATKYPAGLATSGTTGLTLSVQVDSDAQVDLIREAIRAARAPFAVTAGHFAVHRTP